MISLISKGFSDILVSKWFSNFVGISAYKNSLPIVAGAMRPALCLSNSRPTVLSLCTR